MDLRSKDDVSRLLGRLGDEQEELRASYRGSFFTIHCAQPDSRAGVGVPKFSAHPWLGGSFRPGFYLTVEVDWLQPFDMMLLPREEEGEDSDPLLQRFSISATNESMAWRNLEGDLAGALVDLWERYSVAMNDKEICFGPLQYPAQEMAQDLDQLATALVARKTEKRFTQRELQGYDDNDSAEVAESSEAYGASEIRSNKAVRALKKALVVCLLVSFAFMVERCGSEEKVELDFESGVVNVERGRYFDVKLHGGEIARVSDVFSPVAFMAQPRCRFFLRYTRGTITGLKWGMRLHMSEEQMRDCDAPVGNLFELYEKAETDPRWGLPPTSHSSWNF